MLISRAVNLLKAGSTCMKSNSVKSNLQISRSYESGWYYRKGPATTHRGWTITADILSGFMWWWIFWHCYHDYGHIIGEFPYPDPSKWTDEELGIPPDDYD